MEPVTITLGCIAGVGLITAGYFGWTTYRSRQAYEWSYRCYENERLRANNYQKAVTERNKVIELQTKQIKQVEEWYFEAVAINCEHCNKLFVAKSKTHIYCCHKCRDKARRFRKKQETKAMLLGIGLEDKNESRLLKVAIATGK